MQRWMPFRRFSSTRTSSCWNCGHDTDCCCFFCSTCRKIQPVSENCSYFDFFQIPKQFNLDMGAIEKQYWSLQKLLHPDVFTTTSEKEQDLSALNSSVVNKAYAALKEPRKRVQYLLQLEGIDALNEESKAAVPPELLMEIMEIREEIDQCDDPTELLQLEKLNQSKVNDCIQQLTAAYDQQHDLVQTTNIAVRLQYLCKIKTEIHSKLD